jgi:hypothetical protein
VIASPVIGRPAADDPGGADAGAEAVVPPEPEAAAEPGADVGAEADVGAAADSPDEGADDAADSVDVGLGDVDAAHAASSVVAAVAVNPSMASRRSASRREMRPSIQSSPISSAMYSRCAMVPMV